MKKAEFEACQQNKVADIIEIKIGLDGVVLANAKTGRKSASRRKSCSSVLAKEIHDENLNFIPNPHKVWRDIDPLLPDIKIEVFGPPETSGTRDAFLENVMEKGAKGFGALRDMKMQTRRPAPRTTKRSGSRSVLDGAYTSFGENDNLIIQKLESNPNAIGIFGFSYLEENRTKIKSILIRRYRSHLRHDRERQVPRIAFALHLLKKATSTWSLASKNSWPSTLSEKTIGPNGYLVEKGLIAMPKKTSRSQPSRC